jgi:hypothetical protein
MYGRRKLALNSVGLILLVFGGILFIVGFGSDQKYGQTLESSQLSVGGALVGIIGRILLWRGSKIKDPANIK